MTCCFFGHKDARADIYPKLTNTIKYLITELNVSSFLVGNQGGFDAMVLKALRCLKTDYPEISYNVVLAYMPTEKQEYDPYKFGETILPEGIEEIHPKFAISWRNKWMVDESEYVIAFVSHSWGGAAKFIEYAAKKKKKIYNIAVESPI
jgi:uncharacterized phage-like protein YoqJ